MNDIHGKLRRPLLTLAAVLWAANALAQSSPPTPLYGTDALGRTMPSPSDVRAFRDDRYVGVFYFLWLEQRALYDNSKILAQHPEAHTTTASPPWGPPMAYHWWGEPLFGYYRSTDPWVLRRHAALLADAGIDFLVFDATNAVIYQKEFLALCRVFEEQRRQGDPTLQITFMLNTRAGPTAQRIYEALYKPGLYPDLWFRWRGKPLLICDPAEVTEELAAFFTLRKAHWPFELVNTHNAWHWEATYPQVYSYDQDPDRPEQVNVSVGQNLHQDSGRVEMMSTGWARGRSYHDGAMDPHPDAYRHGYNFEEQWQRAFALDPEVVFLTGWNEWIAMQLNREGGSPVFCDQYNLEFSRDIEMMNGGYGDNYYLHMAANIRRFKGMEQGAGKPITATIDIEGPFTQWESVEPLFRDHALDTLPRDFPGCGDTHYRHDTGRNDFRVLKVAADADYVYFYARTRDPISPASDPNWMWLLIGVDDADAPDWEGFHFLVNRHRTDDSTSSIESSRGGWHWQPAGNVTYRTAGQEVHLAIPRTILALPDGPPALSFKWLDNPQKPGDILDAYVHGDAAPNGRFRYRTSQ